MGPEVIDVSFVKVKINTKTRYCCKCVQFATFRVMLIPVSFHELAIFIIELGSVGMENFYGLN